MKVTFPHLGNAYIAIETLLQALGHQAITPPLNTKRTLEWGSKYSPPEICLPFKTILGNMLEGIELGADSVFMIGGWGPCRLGYYAETQRVILENLNQQIEFITLEVPRHNYSSVRYRLQKIFADAKLKQSLQGAQLAWAKLKVVDYLESLSLQVRPRECVLQTTSTFLELKLQELRTAQSMACIKKIGLEGEMGLRDLIDFRKRDGVLKVGLVGEIYTLLEPYVNLRLEERLGDLGVEVVRTVSLSGWIEEHIFKNALGLYDRRSLFRSSSGYLENFVGGHGLETIAHSVDLAHEHLAGIIHIFPLSCMPEVIAQAILPQISDDKKIPILSLVVDEHSGDTGFQTRLEAFVDLLERRKSLCL